MAHCLDKIQECTGKEDCECSCDKCFDEMFEDDEDYDEDEDSLGDDNS